MRVSVVLSLTCCALLIPAAAQAGTARIGVGSDCEEFAGDPCRYWTRVVYRGDGSEGNVVSVRAAARRVIIRDRGAPMRATGACVRLAAHAVSCPLHEQTPDGEGAADWETPTVHIDAGNGDDRLVADGADVSFTASLGPGGDVAAVGVQGYVAGGSGNDRVRLTAPGNADGDAGNDVLVANAGANMLNGGAGDDDLRGGKGPDTLLPGDGNDRVHGGSGVDALSYTDAAGVTVNLATGHASSANGRVRLRAIEGVFGSAGDDVLVGNGRANTFTSVGGRDEMHGGDGEDTLTSPASGSSCGAGRDTVAVPYANDLAPPMRGPAPRDCELASLGGLARINLRLRVERDRVIVKVVGVREAATGWELRAGWGREGALRGHAETTGATASVDIALNTRGRACVTRSACRASLTVSEGESRSRPLPLILT